MATINTLILDFLPVEILEKICDNLDLNSIHNLSQVSEHLMGFSETEHIDFLRHRLLRKAKGRAIHFVVLLHHLVRAQSPLITIDEVKQAMDGLRQVPDNDEAGCRTNLCWFLDLTDRLIDHCAAKALHPGAPEDVSIVVPSWAHPSLLTQVKRPRGRFLRISNRGSARININAPAVLANAPLSDAERGRFQEGFLLLEIHGLLSRHSINRTMTVIAPSDLPHPFLARLSRLEMERSPSTAPRCDTPDCTIKSVYTLGNGPGDFDYCLASHMASYGSNVLSLALTQNAETDFHDLIFALMPNFLWLSAHHLPLTYANYQAPRWWLDIAGRAIVMFYRGGYDRAAAPKLSEEEQRMEEDEATEYRIDRKDINLCLDRWLDVPRGLREWRLRTFRAKGWVFLDQDTFASLEMPPYDFHKGGRKLG
ncbi:hypothetical protein B0H66DRAFT_623171 [Apodospora peruviana]|uniref:F-box domain-containing protein n=1 Tax=Apodospora peruviana TaxID=516989 RepID=A0AAE0I5Z4_9PEZI|nr:hypothetical protein B0H66DRAFT_623171 [Apodospora peruviana]